MSGQIHRQPLTLFVMHIFFEEELAIEIRRLNRVMVERFQVANTFADKSLAHFRANTTRTDQDGFGSFQSRLIKAGNQFLPVRDAKSLVSWNESFGHDSATQF